MQKWKIAALGAIILLMLVIAADAAMIVYYATLPAPKYEAQKTWTPAVQATFEKPPAPAPAEIKRAQTEAALFPPPPAANGAEKEYWEGYYYYSVEPFEQAVARNVQRSRFWFEVRRTADGAFQAASNELGGPDASIQGVIDRTKGTMQFEKSYTTGQLNWHYDGEWSAAAKRINGFYRSPQGGPNQGGFVLFPRRLQPEEIARYEQRNEEILIQKIDKDVLDILNQGQPQGKAPKANDDVF